MISTFSFLSYVRFTSFPSSSSSCIVWTSQEMHWFDNWLSLSGSPPPPSYASLNHPIMPHIAFPPQQSERSNEEQCSFNALLSVFDLCCSHSAKCNLCCVSEKVFFIHFHFNAKHGVSVFIALLSLMHCCGLWRCNLWICPNELPCLRPFSLNCLTVSV